MGGIALSLLSWGASRYGYGKPAWVLSSLAVVVVLGTACRAGAQHLSRSREPAAELPRVPVSDEAARHTARLDTERHPNHTPDGPTTGP